MAGSEVEDKSEKKGTESKGSADETSPRERLNDEASDLRSRENSSREAGSRDNDRQTSGDDGTKSARTNSLETKTPSELVFNAKDTQALFSSDPANEFRALSAQTKKSSANPSDDKNSVKPGQVDASAKLPELSLDAARQVSKVGDLPTRGIELPGANPVSPERQATFDQLANQLNEALRAKDAKKVRDIIEPLDKESRDGISASYQKKFGSARDEALSKDIQSLGNDGAKLNNILKSPDSKNDDAARLSLELKQAAQGDKGADLRLREIFGTLNAEGINKLAADFEKQTGQSFKDAIKNSNGISDATKKALELLSKGVDGRDQADNVALAKLGLQEKDLHLMEIALRGKEGEPARQQLSSDPAFVQEVNDKFKNDAVARDILKDGRISLETIANRNNSTGLFGASNIANLELALRNATPAERESYARGKEIALSLKPGENPNLSESQKKDLELFQKTKSAIESLVAGKTPSGDLFSANQSDGAQILKDKLSLKDADLKGLATDAKLRADLEGRVGNGIDPQSALLKSLLKRAGAGEDVSKLNPSEQVLHDKVSGASPFKTILDAEKLLQADPSLRERLTKLDMQVQFGGVPTDTGRTPEERRAANEQRNSDLAILNVLRAATNEGVKNADKTAFPTIASGNNPFANAAFHQLLSKGNLSPSSLAALGFPREVVAGRLANETDPQQIARTNALLDAGSQVNERNSAQLARLEDAMLRGGSLVGDLAVAGRNPESVLKAIENMTSADFQRARDPKLAADFRRDIERALQNPGLDQKVRERALNLFDDKIKASSFDASKEVRRSPVDVASENKLGLVQSVSSMGAQDQLRYRTDEAFRKQVDDKIAKDFAGQDFDAHRTLAKNLLDTLRQTGSIPKPEQMTPADRLMFNSINGADKDALLKDMNAVLADPEARRRILAPTSAEMAAPSAASDAALRNITIDTIQKVFEKSSVGLQAAMDSIRRTGKLEDRLLVQADIPASEKLSKLHAMAASEPEFARNYAGLLTFNNPQLAKVAEVIRGQNGEVKPEDKIAAGDIKSADALKREIGNMTLEQVKELRDAYARKYGSSLDADVLAKMPEKERSAAVDLLSSNKKDAREFLFDSLGRLQDSKTGFAPDGTAETAQRSLQILAETLQKASFDGTQIPAEDQARLKVAFEQALDQFKGSKDEYAKRLLTYGETALLVASGVLAAAASGGTLGPAALATIAAAGTALTPAARLAVLEFVKGRDFDKSTSNLLKEIGIGLAEGALNFSPFALDAAAALSLRSAAKAAERTAAHAGMDTAASEKVREALQEPLKNAFTSGRTGLTDKELADALKKAGIPDKDIPTVLPTLKRETQTAAESEAFGEKLKLLRRGDAQPDKDFGKLVLDNAPANAGKPIQELRQISEKISANEFREARKMALENLPPGTKIKEVEIKPANGKSVEDLLKEMAKVGSYDPESKVLTVPVLKDVSRIGNKEELNRLKAEEALIALEERIHAMRAASPEALSKTFKDVEALGLAASTERGRQEQEVVAALSEAGWPTDMLRKHFGANYSAERESVLSFMDLKKASTILKDEDRALLASSLAESSPELRQAFLDNVSTIDKAIAEKIAGGSLSKEQAEKVWSKMVTLIDDAKGQNLDLNVVRSMINSPEQVIRRTLNGVETPSLADIARELTTLNNVSSGPKNVQTMLNQLKTIPAEMKKDPFFQQLADSSIAARIISEGKISGETTTNISNAMKELRLSDADRSAVSAALDLVAKEQKTEVLQRELVSAFMEKELNSVKAMTHFLEQLQKQRFKNFAELKSVFGASDQVNGLVIFDIGGNKYRVAGTVDYATGKVAINKVMTHSQYDYWNKTGNKI